MTNTERIKALKELRRPDMATAGFPSREDFAEWHSRVAPLLLFSIPYHTSFVGCASRALVPGARRDEYTYLLSQMDSVVVQAITELEHGLTPVPPSDDIKLTDEHGLWWFFQHCTTKTRGWMLAAMAAGLGAVIAASYFAGRSHFISQIVDLFRKSTTP